MSWEDRGDGSRDGWERGGRSNVRLVVLVLVGIVVSNVVAALLFDRDQGLGLDEVFVLAVGVGLALLVEFGLLRRRRR